MTHSRIVKSRAMKGVWSLGNRATTETFPKNLLFSDLIFSFCSRVEGC